MNETPDSRLQTPDTAQAPDTAQTPDALLELCAVHAAYGQIPALKNINLRVHSGEIVSLIGCNGAGKTTTLLCCSGIERIVSGRIRWRGQDIQHVPAHAIVSLGIAHVPEGRKIFPRLSVLENLKLGAFTRTNAREIADDIDRSYSLFPILAERRQQSGGTLSGGEQQMLAIARALMSRPRMLLMDEPSMGVAPLITLAIFDTIKRLNRDGLSILLVEQNARLALKIAHRAYVLETGSIILSDSAANVAANPKVREAYLGE